MSKSDDAPDMTTDHNSILAARLKAIREKKGLSRYAVGQMAGITQEQYARIEAGGRRVKVDGEPIRGGGPTWATICRIADALGVGMDELREPKRRRERKKRVEAVEGSEDVAGEAETEAE